MRFLKSTLLDPGYALLFLALIHAASVRAQSFTDVAADMNLDFTVPIGAESPTNLPFGGGLSFHDFNNDGWDDLVFTVSNDSIRFFRNDEGVLTAIPSLAYTQGFGKAVQWVDYDNDGDLDLFTTAIDGPLQLYDNNGSFEFSEVTVVAGLPEYNANSCGASWGDYDRDGLLDLYVCQFQWETLPPEEPRWNHLYHNEGDGTFTDVTEAAGVSNGITQTFQSIWYDQDRDGWPDLLLVNDRDVPNAFFHNNADGTFTELAMSNGFGTPGANPMTLSPGDMDNDGDLDMFLTNTGAAGGGPSILLMDNGDGTYTDVADEWGVADMDVTWGWVWPDYDNDGFRDLYYATFEPGQPSIPNRLYRNFAGTGFVDAGAAFLSPHEASSFCPAIGDLNNDGHVDIAVHNVDPFPPFLWVNSGSDGNSLKITLQGTASNSGAIGTWIELYHGTTVQTHYTMCGQDLLGQNSQHIHFGIRSADMADSVRVTYPSGHVDVYYGLEAGMDHLLVEGDTYQPVIEIQGVTEFCNGGSVVLNAGEHEAYLWSTGDTGQFITVSESGTYTVTTTNQFGVQGIGDEVEVTVFPVPIVDYSSMNPACAGESTGSIELSNLSGTGIGNVTWDNGSVGSSLSGLDEGEYEFVLTDLNGCEAIGTVSLSDPPELFVSTVTSPAVNGNDGTLEVSVFGGTPPYVYQLDGVEVSAIVEDLAPGDHSLIVTDMNSCVWASTVTIENFTSIDELDAGSFGLFPNPGRSAVQVSGLDEGGTLLLQSVNGGAIHSLTIGAGRTVDLEHLAAGIYLVRVVGAPLIAPLRYVHIP